MKIVFSETTPRKIDLFTQKAPFDGKGINQSSDAFQPQELVILYALVTYNEAPVANKLVAFQVNNPTNAIQNMTIIGVNSTDQSGVAAFSFRIPWPEKNAEEIIFGEWFAIATVDVAEKVVVDTLTFQVGWIVQITDITTLNFNWEPQKKFSKGEEMIFDLIIKNIALTPKSATLVIAAYDSASYPIMFIELDYLEIMLGESRLNVSSKVPHNAFLGNATVSAIIYTAPPKEGGIPYSPQITSTFEIVPFLVKRYYLTVRTDPVGLTSIPGEEWYDEGVKVSLVAPQYVNVAADARYRFFYWDVDGTPFLEVLITVTMDANHTVTAHYILQYQLTIRISGLDTGYAKIYNGSTLLGTASYVNPCVRWFDEDDLILLDVESPITNVSKRFMFSYWSGGISGSNRPNPIIMNTAKDITANYKTQYLLTVRTEPADLSLQPIRNPEGEAGPADGWWYDASTNVTILAQAINDYSFHRWEVDNHVMDGGYSITVHMDAPHTVTAYYTKVAAGWFVPDWLWWLLLLLILIILLLLIWLYLRRRRKKGEEAFHSGWTAWYYCYDLRKIRKG
ncbi:MAG: hypothetical protein QXQ94_05100 [Candidatus Bathyarchaeia archaeon]